MRDEMGWIGWIGKTRTAGAAGGERGGIRGCGRDVGGLAPVVPLLVGFRWVSRRGAKTLGVRSEEKA